MATYIYDEAVLRKLKHWTEASNVHVYGADETRNLFEVIADETDDKPIELPIITIRRSRGYNIIDGGTTKRPLSYDGHAISDIAFDNYNEALTFCFENNIDEQEIYPKSYWVSNRKFKTFTEAAEYCGEHGISTNEVHTANWQKYYIPTTVIHPKYTEAIRAIPISISYQLDVYARYAQEADILMRNLVFNIINYPGFTISIPKANLEHTARLVLNDVIEDNSSIPERFIEGNMTRLTANISVDNARLWDTRKLRNTEINVVLDDTYEQEYDIYFPDYMNGDMT